MPKKRKTYALVMKSLMLLAAGATAALVLFLLVYILVKGVPNITWELLSTKPSYLTERIGILPDILNTIYIVLATLFIVLPLGVGAAISNLTGYGAAGDNPHYIPHSIGNLAVATEQSKFDIRIADCMSAPRGRCGFSA